MIYFGQSVDLCKRGTAVFIGDDPAGDHVFVTEEGEELVLDDADLREELDFLYQNDKASPTGKSVYYGGLCRYVRFPKLMMKRPTSEALKAEFAAIRSLKRPQVKQNE